MQLPALTFVLVNELYTLSTGSGTSGTGLTHSGIEDEDALGASVMIDMLRDPVRWAIGGRYNCSPERSDWRGLLSREGLKVERLAN